MEVLFQWNSPDRPTQVEDEMHKVKASIGFQNSGNHKHNCFINIRDKQTDRQKDKLTDIQIDKQTDRHTDE